MKYNSFVFSSASASLMLIVLTKKFITIFTKIIIIIEDINNHTMKAMINAKNLGGYKSISERDSFYMEYWELEQMKLRI